MALTKTDVSKLYTTLIGRASETEGNIWWQTHFDDMTLAAEAMLGSAAVATYFGGALDSAQGFVETIYANTLNKTANGTNGSIADPDGIAYWIGRLDGSTGSIMTRAEMIKSFIYEVSRLEQEQPTAASNQFFNRVEVSDYTADTLATAPSDYKTSLAFQNSGNTGLVITHDKDTVTSAKSAIDAINTPPTALTISNISIADGNFSIGDTIDIIVTFSGTIVHTGTDAVLKLNIGGDTSKEATWLSETSNSITFQYTIETGLTDSDGIAVPADSFILSSDTIKDDSNNTVVVTHTEQSNAAALVNTTSPSITSGSTGADIAENSGAGQTIYSAAATDTSTVTYSLKAVADHSLLSINANSGVVILNADPDFETKASYSFTVIADDSFGNSAEQAVTFDIIDVDEGNPSFHSNINSGLGLLSTSSTLGVSALASGTYWDLDGNITYSFNTTAFGYPDDYENSDNITGWSELSSAQKTAIRAIFNQLDDLLNISFTEVADTAAQSDGDIQLNIVDIEDDFVGYAYFPGDDPISSGDIFLSSEFNSDPDFFGLNAGETGWGIMVHELGHALGLDHPFDSEDTTVLPVLLDDINHTVMSYTNNNMVQEFVYTEDSSGTTIESSGTFLEAQLYSLYDIAALQSIYGVNTTTNTGNTIYTYNYTDYAMNTIWDAGGIDTIDLSSTIGSSTIDLNPGSLNSADQYTPAEIISMHQALVDVDGNNFDQYIIDTINFTETDDGLYTGENNLGIATGTIIENIKTGSGSDTITDNEVDNIIQTFSGNDHIHLGNGGYDTVDGGAGYDTLYINLAQQDVSIFERSGDGSYDLIATDFAVNFIGIETIQFSDSTLNII